MAFDRRMVVSTNIAEVAYDSQDGILEVSFNNGRIYEYYRVPAQIFDGLVIAASPGTFFNDFVKDRFSYRRVR